MRNFVRCLLAALLVLLVSIMTVTNAEARRGHGGHGPRVSFGLWLGPGWVGSHYYSPFYYPYYPSYYPPEPPIVIQQQPEVYVQPAPQQDQPVYWYFCKDPQGYYPYVKQCPSGWMKVVPTPPGPGSAPPE